MRTVGVGTGVSDGVGLGVLAGAEVAVGAVGRGGFAVGTWVGCPPPAGMGVGGMAVASTEVAGTEVAGMEVGGDEITTGV